VVDSNAFKIHLKLSACYRYRIGTCR